MSFLFVSPLHAVLWAARSARRRFNGESVGSQPRFWHGVGVQQGIADSLRCLPVGILRAALRTAASVTAHRHARTHKAWTWVRSWISFAGRSRVPSNSYTSAFKIWNQPHTELHPPAMFARWRKEKKIFFRQLSKKYSRFIWKKIAYGQNKSRIGWSVSRNGNWRSSRLWWKKNEAKVFENSEFFSSQKLGRKLHGSPCLKVKDILNSEVAPADQSSGWWGGGCHLSHDKIFTL